MKTKNQTEQVLLELAASKAANEDGFTAGSSAARESASPAAGRKSSWSPKEVWRTRVKIEPQSKDGATL
jgi:hypothetical protein